MSKNSGGISAAIAWLIIIPIGLYFEATRTFSLILLALFVFALVGIFLYAKSSDDKAKMAKDEDRKRVSAIRSKARAKIKRIVDKHLETLARRRIALVTVDQYGAANGGAWNQEIRHFADRIIRPELTEEEADSITYDGQFTAILQELIEDRTKLRVEEIEETLTFSENMMPREFEKWCCARLETSGWKGITTKVTGDQGADIVAEWKSKGKKPLRLVIQCKLYGSSVGNKAVQEAHAARAHYLADVAAVVTNAPYTKSAKELAQTTGVFLWHYSDLDRTTDLLNGQLRFGHGL